MAWTFWLQNKIWVATESGIVIIDTTTNSVTNYYKGIQNILLRDNLKVECLMTLYLTEKTWFPNCF